LNFDYLPLQKHGVLEAFEIIWVGEEKSSNRDNTDRKEKYCSQHLSSFSPLSLHIWNEFTEKKSHNKLKTFLYLYEDKQ